MFEAAVDRFGRSVAAAGPAEVGQHVSGPAFERSPERTTSIPSRKALLDSSERALGDLDDEQIWQLTWAMLIEVHALTSTTGGLPVLQQVRRIHREACEPSSGEERPAGRSTWLGRYRCTARQGL